MAFVGFNGLPKFDGDDLEGTVRKLYNYTRELQEQLEFILMNLDGDNVEGFDEIRETNEQTRLEMVEVRKDTDSLAVRVGDTEGGITELRQTAAGIETRVGNSEGSIASLQQTASGLTASVSANTGDISTLKQTASGLTSTVAGHTSSISTLQQTASGLTSRVSTAEGNISSVKQTASGLSSSVSDLSGKYSSLKQTVDGFDVAGQVRQELEDGVAEVVFKRGSTVLGYIDYDSDRSMRFSGKNGITLDGGDEDRITLDGDVEAYGDFRIYLSSSRWWEFTRTGIYYHSGSSTSVTVMQSA